MYHKDPEPDSIERASVNETERKLVLWDVIKTFTTRLMRSMRSSAWTLLGPSEPESSLLPLDCGQELKGFSPSDTRDKFQFVKLVVAYAWC